MLFLKFCAQLGSVRPKSLFLCARYRFFVVDFALFDKLVCFFTHQLVFLSFCKTRGYCCNKGEINIKKVPIIREIAFAFWQFCRKK